MLALSPQFSAKLAFGSSRRYGFWEFCNWLASEDAEALEVWQPGELPAAYVQRVTQLKLQAARQRLQHRGLPPAPVLSADTTVALDQVIYGKPENDADAARMLRCLSGRTHQVLTAVAVADGPAVHEALSVSEVRFKELTEADISRYVASGEPKGKAGAYAVQGRAAAFIEHLSGSYSGVMGLPLFETSQLLTRIKLF